MIVEYKTPIIKKEFEDACLILRLLCEDFVRLSNAFQIIPTVTRVMEKVNGSSGVHEVGRGVDFRDEFNGTYTYSSEQREHIIETIEARWHRNDGKPSIVWHRFSGGPLHVHLQISASTMVYFSKT